VTTTPAVEDLKRVADALRAGVALVEANGAILYSNKAFSEAVFTQADRARLTQAIARVCDGKAASAVIDATLADQLAAERRQPVAGRDHRLVERLVARARKLGLHQAGAPRLERRRRDHGALDLRSAFLYRNRISRRSSFSAF